MNSEFDIIIPRLCVKHIEALQMLAASSKVANVITSLSALTGVDKKILYRCKYSDILNAVEVIMAEAESDMKNTIIKKSVEINGQTFRLLDPARITVGWAIDYSLIDERKPSHIAALMYVEDGKEYSDGDLLKRAEVMEDLPLADYAAATAFFLRLLGMVTKAAALQEEMRKRKMRSIN